mmetsp:Transcript_2055/g.6636  ORF Transcript_2055/g.6636 Transcript_2055/m.6636 type:complete len:243 (-) Transcript_2055:654-1382(-)
MHSHSHASRASPLRLPSPAALPLHLALRRGRAPVPAVIAAAGPSGERVARRRSRHPACGVEGVRSVAGAVVATAIAGTEPRAVSAPQRRVRPHTEPRHAETRWWCQWRRLKRPAAAHGSSTRCRLAGGDAGAADAARRGRAPSRRINVCGRRIRGRRHGRRRRSVRRSRGLVVVHAAPPPTAPRQARAQRSGRVAVVVGSVAPPRRWRPVPRATALHHAPVHRRLVQLSDRAEIRVMRLGAV